jgi:hypothetical protein
MLNLNNRVRFTNAGWQLAALLPIPFKKQGNYKGKVTLATRKCQLFHGKNDNQCVSIFILQF